MAANVPGWDGAVINLLSKRAPRASLFEARCVKGIEERRWEAAAPVPRAQAIPMHPGDLTAEPHDPRVHCARHTGWGRRSRGHASPARCAGGPAGPARVNGRAADGRPSGLSATTGETTRRGGEAAPGARRAATTACSGTGGSRRDPIPLGSGSSENLEAGQSQAARSLVSWRGAEQSGIGRCRIPIGTHSTESIVVGG